MSIDQLIVSGGAGAEQQQGLPRRHGEAEEGGPGSAGKVFSAITTDPGSAEREEPTGGIPDEQVEEESHGLIEKVSQVSNPLVLQ